MNSGPSGDADEQDSSETAQEGGEIPAHLLEKFFEFLRAGHEHAQHVNGRAYDVSYGFEIRDFPNAFTITPTVTIDGDPDMIWGTFYPTTNMVKLDRGKFSNLIVILGSHQTPPNQPQP